MGQYYAYVNTERKEFFYPHATGTGAKALEQFNTEAPNLLIYLLIKSDGSGGGDIYNGGKLLGSWAGQPVVLIGDYDSSKLYEKAGVEFTDIGPELVAEYNKATNSDVKPWE